MLWFTRIFLLVAISQVESQTEYIPGVFEGDIILTNQEVMTYEALANPNDPTAPQNAVVRNTRSLWRNATIPYVLDSSLNSQARSAIAEAIADYRRQTCVEFIPRSNEADYVRIFPGRGCFSFVGRVGGPQDMSIGTGCEYKGIVLHEIFHALGRWHEQSRPDRDQFVRILTENILTGTESNFEKTNPAFVTTQGVPYDIGSIMHYSSRAFSRSDQPTILPVDRTISPSSLGQRNGLSAMDLQHVQTLYCGGGGGSTVSWSAWSSWSSCSRTCNGGTRSRTRTCNGGTSCAGSNIQIQQCNTEPCPKQAFWSPWGSWSDCSRTCGGGRQRMSRKCLNGNTCVGRSSEFRSCSMQNCPQPAVWASWSSWSSCSKSCQGGYQERRRRCLNGNDCPGISVNSSECNTKIPCEIPKPNGEWSSWTNCSAQCGGGSRYRMRNCGRNSLNCEPETQSCNTEDCVPEPELRGLRYRGCWYLNVNAHRLGSFENTAPELEDDASQRIRPVSKCGNVIHRRGYDYFGVTVGICVSGSNYLGDYQYYPSFLCRDGKGAYTERYGGWFVMDVYQIMDPVSFSDSIAELNGPNATTGGIDVMTTGSGHALTYNLALLVSSILAVVLTIAVM